MKTSLSVYVWDNGKDGDCYTIAIDIQELEFIDIYGCNDTPFHPTYGIGQFSHSIDRTQLNHKETKHFGKLVDYTALCPEVQRYIRQLINMED